MRPVAWVVCAAWIALAVGSAARGAVRGLRDGRGPAVRARLASPTVYLFAAYLVVAAFLTPRSPGESASPLLGLAVTLPLAYAAATLASAAAPARPPLVAAALALLHGGAVLAAGAIVLAVASPAFVPPWLR